MFSASSIITNIIAKFPSYACKYWSVTRKVEEEYTRMTTALAAPFCRGLKPPSPTWNPVKVGITLRTARDSNAPPSIAVGI
jgi:hypothetical protein